MNPTPAITDQMTRDAALVLAAWWQSRTAPTPDELEHGRALPDPTPWLPLAREVVEAALAEFVAREGEAFDAERARLQADVERLTGLVLGQDVKRPGKAA